MSTQSKSRVFLPLLACTLYGAHWLSLALYQQSCFVIFKDSTQLLSEVTL